jgi:outer membrane protein OmpA-like peptidoglycan-associated protein
VRTLAILGLALTAAVGTAGAQRAHQFELSGFGSYTHYDKTFRLESRVGGGARLGYFFTDIVGAELEAGYQDLRPSTGTTSPSLTLGSASLSLNFGNARHLFYLLGGYSRLDFEKVTPYRFTDDAVHGAIGERLFLGDHAALRVEVRAMYTPNTGFPGGTWAGHVVGSLGLSLFTGTGTLADEDHDGVPDKADVCANTPLGATVDVHGCPLDSDHDGVYDGLDQCPGTPVGARVDAKGCPMDSDHDGVYDGLDQCSNTPAGAHVDAKGCPTDADGDGVPDGIDQCPNTPAGAIVDAAGCPLDSDKDGVPDGIDKCPNTPPGTEVDSTGCQRFKDSDGDGVPDDRDKCPGTPPGSRVDANGCVILFTPERTPVILRGVTFEPGRAVLQLESFTVLNIVAQSLVANPTIRIEIAGYTDGTGSAATNLRLSQARAEVVRAYLVSKGVAPTRMVARGYGASNPIAVNTTAEGRAQNRRVELHQLP